MRILPYLLAATALFCVGGCRRPVQETSRPYSDTQDVHSYANPQQVRVTHVDLDLTAEFDARKLSGSATLSLQRSDASAPLILDTRDLTIRSVEVPDANQRFAATEYKVGPADKILGSPLTIALPRHATQVRVNYETSPSASGLQWVTPAQTAGKKYPFLYTQSQAIHARSWIPLQDTPGVRITYRARIRTPQPLLAVMSAVNDHAARPDGDYSFTMDQAIPSYLIALAVGDLRHHSYGPRAGVYAEASVIKSAVAEFADLDKMLAAAESLFGPYRWDVYDVLVLPPSFPYGGMENPRLTFATPTLLAGDKSLVGVIAHEIAHSWSGNLVTNATWRDFWLNEGFTTYIENRIQEVVYGPARAEMEAALEVVELEREMAELPEADRKLYLDLKGRDPDEGGTLVAYTKGALFLRRLEQIYGRDRFDPFLKSYFDRFAFQSIVTAQFLDYLRHGLFSVNPTLAAQVDLDEWLTQPGLPASAPRPVPAALNEIATVAKQWAAGQRATSSLPIKSWSTQHWLYFLNALPSPMDRARLTDLDRAFSLTASRNSEIAAQWLRMAIQSRYEPAYGRLERFLIEVGRRKYLKPLYTELAKTPEGRRRAQAIFQKARAGYHPISASTIEAVLKG